MRALAGFAGLHLLLLAAGLAALHAVGLLAAGWRTLVSALGPALLAGVALVVPLQIALLVIGMPLTLLSFTLVSLGCVAVLIAARRRRGARSAAGADGGRATPSLRRAATLAAGAYLGFGAYALARAPVRGDDARIWSLKGLTLSYYDTLRPEIFHNPLALTAHPVYPLLQPVLEADLFRAMGRPELRFFHAELWLLFAAGIWMAAYLIARFGAPASGPSAPAAGAFAPPAWIAVLALVAVAPIAITGIAIGDADVTGSILLATGTLAMGLWIDRREPSCLALAALLLAAAANVKDEDMVAAAIVLIVAGVVVAVRPAGVGLRRMAALRQVAWASSLAVALTLPWRIWVAVNHLSDNVTPPLPRALSPVYILDRTVQLHRTAAAMVTDVRHGWGWLPAIFIATCAVCLATRTASRTTVFYLGAVGAIVAALLWLYTTTPVSLSYLIPTSMGRTVGVFMAITPLAAAHLLARLDAERREQAT